MSFRVPSYYVLSRACPMESVNAALAVLALTPFEGTIISDIRDLPLARETGVEVVRVPSDENALAMAAHIAEHNALVSLVIGELPVGVVRMVYADGSHEEIEYATQA